MLFCWFRENKYFRRDKGLKGQIAPFLIVAIVIMVVAAMAVINVGKTSLIKTYTANAADAGALAAASIMAAALNSLAEANETLRDTYDIYEQQEQERYDTIMEDHEEMQLYIYISVYLCLRIASLISCNAASSFIAAALSGAICYLMYQAMDILATMNVDIQLMQDTLKSHRDDTHEMLCDLMGIMDEAHDAAEEQAFDIAEANSGLARFNPSVDNRTKYNVSITTRVPQVQNYSVEHMRIRYSDAKEDWEDCRKLSEKLAKVCKVMAISFGALAVIYLIAGILMLVITKPLGCLLHQGAMIRFFIAYAIIMAVVVYFAEKLEDDIQDVFNQMVPPYDETTGISSCSEVEDLIVGQITDINIDYRAFVRVSGTHVGSSTGLWNFRYGTITSGSYAKFSGGDVGTFSTGYYPRLTGIF